MAAIDVSAERTLLLSTVLLFVATIYAAWPQPVLPVCWLHADVQSGSIDSNAACVVLGDGC